MVNVIINSIILIAFLIIVWQLQKIQSRLLNIKRQQEEAKFALANIQELLIEFGQGNKTTEESLVKALNEICQALNNYFNIAGGYMNNSSNALLNIAVSLIPIVDDVKETALHNENYEMAQGCIQIINNLKALTKS